MIDFPQITNNMHRKALLKKSYTIVATVTILFSILGEKKIPTSTVKHYGVQARQLQWRFRRSERYILRTCFTCS